MSPAKTESQHQYLPRPNCLKQTEFKSSLCGVLQIAASRVRIAVSQSQLGVATTGSAARPFLPSSGNRCRPAGRKQRVAAVASNPTQFRARAPRWEEPHAQWSQVAHSRNRVLVN